MNFFKNLQIRGKMILIILTVAALSLFLFSAVNIYTDLQFFKKNMVRNLTVLASTVGANSRAAIVFNDAAAGKRILSSLKEEQQIEFAALYDRDGNIFVTYSRDEGTLFELPGLKDGRHERETHFELIKNILLEDEIIGKIYLHSHMEELQAQIRNHIFLVGLMLLATLAIAFVLSIKLQGLISKPILSLAEIAKKISQESDYSIRAHHESNDELGTLYSGFNEMLRQIQKRDLELSTYQATLEDLVKERTRELEAAQKELVRKERLALLGELSAKVSHEIRNPLGAIRNIIYFLTQLKLGKSPEVESKLQMAERNIKRCDDIIEELLEFARPQEKELAPTVIDPWLEELLTEYTFPEEITVDKKLGAGVKVNLERERFRRAVINILQNACQALMEKYNERVESSQEKDEYLLVVETRVNAARFELRIRDTGIGIPPDQLGKIHEPLYSTKSFGVGLGLPIVKEITQQHDGGLEIESQPNAGTIVTLWLPLIKEENTP